MNHLYFPDTVCNPHSDSTLNDVEEEMNFNDAASYHSINSETMEYSPFPVRNNSGNSSKNFYGGPELSIHDDHDSIPSVFLNPSSRSLVPEELPPSFQRQMMGSKEKSKNNKGASKSSPKATKEDIDRYKNEKAENYFQHAIKRHEEGDLNSSALYFKKSADLNHPIGLLFFGLCLRHGWGCEKNEKMSFLYLQRAGELIAPEAKSLNSEIEGPAKKELAMAIYELGQSYFHGWGVPKSRKTAVHYYELAANLGDPDAQVDLASSYENGDGVKRDMKKAAHYYRLAHEQGIDQFGNSWIFKKKYDP
ncbi:Protein DSF2 [Smittium mucronatum]|uniref:Protein DSF2 n=1 Tax=Smittium mucronatum TaxID=133383 RepID=A0A1R0H3R7_9FUNG|nr:Protein DSF2 [Smittium mucronatum]